MALKSFGVAAASYPQSCGNVRSEIPVQWGCDLDGARKYAMYVRIVRSTPKEGQAEEFARRWKKFFGGLTPRTPAVRQALVAYDKDANVLLAVSLWEDRPDDAMVANVAAEFRVQVEELLSAPPVFEGYEVLAEL
jgi:heme-degrading monooxygenase HmoA